MPVLLIHGQGAGQPGGHPDAEQLLVGVGEQAADVYLESALFEICSKSAYAFPMISRAVCVVASFCSLVASCFFSVRSKRLLS